MDRLRDIPTPSWDSWGRIPDLLREPTANPTASVILLAAFVLLLLIAIVAWLLLLQQPVRRTAGQVSAGGQKGRPKEPVEVEPEPLGVTLLRWVAVPILVLSAAVVLAGFTTGSRASCLSCHEKNPHAEAGALDPHADVTCVSCHEVGGPLSRSTVLLPARINHFFADTDAKLPQPYGRPISSATCRGCHLDALSGITTNSARGIRNKHKEPLEAGAQCVDCHALASGVVSNQTVGMESCLRCHDGDQAAAECDTCHSEDPARAIRSVPETAGALAARQVENPQCSSCHDQQAEGCDKCHGIRLPHTEEFMAYAHARPGVEDLWDNGGRGCGKCHYEQRRPCTKCHERFISHGQSWSESHGIGISYRAPCACHQQKAYMRGRQFCALCHPTRPAGAKP